MVDIWSGENFLCDRGCNQLIFWKENEHVFKNAFDGVGGDQGSRHACPNRVGWKKGNNGPPPVDRVITEKDLEIAACNPKKHNYVPEIYNNIVGSAYSDRWTCNNCKDRGDKFYMMVHECHGYYKFRDNTKEVDQSTALISQSPPNSEEWDLDDFAS